MRALLYVFIFAAGGLSLATVATSDTLLGGEVCLTEPAQNTEGQ